MLRLRKIAFGIICILILQSCGGDDAKEKAASDKVVANKDITTDPNYQKGLQLIAKSDCLTCHKVEERVTGPSYREVANKYKDRPDAVSYLAGKIITGGNGVWGEVFMTPHADLSREDAETMAKYILLLKN